MKAATKQTKGARQAALVRPHNPDKTFWDGCNVPEELADEWFQTTAQEWATRTGHTVPTSRGVLSRWLHFFSTFNGKSQLIRQRFGRYMQEA
jgi:hypothetical protein